MSNIQNKYDTLSSVYDFLDSIPEFLLYSRWRQLLWRKSSSGKFLEIGIGTGKNVLYYPSGADITGIDISSGMLKKAGVRAGRRQDITFSMHTMNANDLTFPENTFDGIIGSFVFTVLEDPSGVLQEIKRVGKPGGTLLLLEFVRSRSRFAAMIQDILVHLTSAIYDAKINRDLPSLIENAGFQEISTEDVGDGIVTIIQAVLP